GHASAGFFFFQAEDGIRDFHVTGVQTCALPISATWTGAGALSAAWMASRTRSKSRWRCLWKVIVFGSVVAALAPRPPARIIGASPRPLITSESCPAVRPAERHWTIATCASGMVL